MSRAAVVAWHCADCGGIVWEDEPGWKYKVPKPIAGSYVVCAECVPVPWWKKAWPARRDDCA